jgi:hypothetical protein
MKSTPASTNESSRADVVAASGSPAVINTPSVPRLAFLAFANTVSIRPVMNASYIKLAGL